MWPRKPNQSSYLVTHDLEDDQVPLKINLHSLESFLHSSYCCRFAAASSYQYLYWFMWPIPTLPIRICSGALAKLSDTFLVKDQGLQTLLNWKENPPWEKIMTACLLLTVPGHSLPSRDWPGSEGRAAISLVKTWNKKKPFYSGIFPTSGKSCMWLLSCPLSVVL